MCFLKYSSERQTGRQTERHAYCYTTLPLRVGEIIIAVTSAQFRNLFYRSITVVTADATTYDILASPFLPLQLYSHFFLSRRKQMRVDIAYFVGRSAAVGEVRARRVVVLVRLRDGVASSQKSPPHGRRHAAGRRQGLHTAHELNSSWRTPVLRTH